MLSSVGKILIVLFALLLIIIGIQTFGGRDKRQQHHRRRHDANGLIEPSTNLQPMSGGSAQPMDLSKGAATLNSTSLLQTTHTVADTTQQTQPCAADMLFQGCPVGQQFGGMTIMPQTIFPGSYLPPAVFNTSGFIPGCIGSIVNPDPCFQ